MQDVMRGDADQKLVSKKVVVGRCKRRGKRKKDVGWCVDDSQNNNTAGCACSLLAGDRTVERKPPSW